MRNRRPYVRCSKELRGLGCSRKPHSVCRHYFAHPKCRWQYAYCRCSCDDIASPPDGIKSWAAYNRMLLLQLQVEGVQHIPNLRGGRSK